MASPAGRWEESLQAINSYVKAQTIEGARVTLAVFDTNTEFEHKIIRHHTPINAWEPVTATEIMPRGWTPLFDAIREMTRGMEFVNDEKSVLIIVTDGGENASRSTTKAQAKEMIDRIKAKGWQVLFIGADFDAFSEAASVGVGYVNTVQTTRGNYGVTMAMASQKANIYAEQGAAMNWSDGDRKKAVGEKS